MNQKKIVKEFKRIRNMGFLPSKRRHDTGIGKTFEDLLGVDENNCKDPDFEGFEVKTQRQLTTSYMTLFTKSPTGPKGANAILKDTFGTVDARFADIKVLHTSVFAHRVTKCASGYGFRLKVDKSTCRIRLIVSDYTTKRILSDDVYWSFDVLSNRAAHKLKGLFVVVADSKTINTTEYFRYTEAKVYYDFDFERFLTAVENGTVMFDIRIGAYKTQGSSSYGKPHDHGSAFRIRRQNLSRLFSRTLTI